MLNIIKTKYYTFVPGEFFPITDGEVLLNKAEFHKYKLARTIWRLRNWKLTYYQLTHQTR